MKSTLVQRRLRSAALLVLSFAFPFYFAIRGTDWTTGIHPDEISILQTMTLFVEDIPQSVGECVYPEGYFVLSNIYRKAVGFSMWLSKFAQQESSASRDLDLVRAPSKTATKATMAILRRTNATLAGLAGLFLALAVLAATGSAVGGLAASLLGACSPFVVEHAHYAESDISFVFAMSLALWMLFAAVRRRSGGYMVAAAAACAAAFACKYTVAPLVPVCGLTFLWLAPRWGAKRAVKIALACAISGLVAYAIFTPVFFVDFKLYWEKAFRIYGKVHSEIAGSEIAASDTVPFLRMRYIARLLLVQFRAFGFPRMALAAIGSLLIAFRARRLPQGVLAIVAVAAFLAFDFALAPWVRSQEFLPFVIMLSVIPALAMGRLCADGFEKRGAPLGVAAAAVCLAVSAVIALPDAIRVSRQFSSIETRNVARRWLEMTSNPGSRFAAGRFASPALRGGRITTATVFGDAERRWRPGFIDPANPGHEYFVRQTLFPGRGFIDNATGALHPQYAAGWSNFLDHATMLREWRNTPGYQPSFCQLPLEMWATTTADTPFARLRPLCRRATAYYMGQEAYDAAQGGDWLGPIEAIRTVGARKHVRFVPPVGGGAVYAVTRHFKGLQSAKIKWESAFKPRERVIEPGRADYFVYERGALPPAFADFCVRTRVRMRGNDQTSLCLTTITADPVYAAELLARGGSPDRAEALLAACSLPPDLGSAAQKTVRPFPARSFADFARIRFAKFTVYPDSEEEAPAEGDDGDATQSLDLAPESDGNDGAVAATRPDSTEKTPDTRVRLDTEFPVVFDPGEYTISFRLPKDADEPRLVAISLAPAFSQSIESGGSFGLGERVELKVSFDKPTAPRLCGESIAPGGTPHAVTLRDFEIVWTPEIDIAARAEN
ncbi:MAG: glycosyltransferase family 39 protein [Kiritimatiellae bacterium]|nr:glycosyltransferase family 39 protein [Kiritimatiellia bacterium]